MKAPRVTGRIDRGNAKSYSVLSPVALYSFYCMKLSGSFTLPARVQRIFNQRPEVTTTLGNFLVTVWLPPIG